MHADRSCGNDERGGDERGNDELDRIIEATFDCLKQSHDAPVSVSVILTRAGVSSRAFYRHFQSKDELFVAMLHRVTEVLAAQLDTIAEGAGDPLDRLRTWISQMFGLVSEPELHGYLAVIDSDEMRSAKGYREAREKSRVRREASLVDILRAGRAQGTFPLAEPESDAIAIAALVTRELTSLRILVPTQRLVSHARVESFSLRALGVVGTNQTPTAQ